MPEPASHLPAQNRWRRISRGLVAILAGFVRAHARGVAGGLRAEPVELVAVAQHGEAAEPLGDALLQALDLVVLELEDQAALHADQVIVVVADDLVARLAVAELALDGEAAVDQELERPVDRGVADLGLALAHLEEQLVDRDVLAGAKELLDDRLALRGDIEPAILDVRAPALLELARVVGTKFRAVAHVASFPASARVVKHCSRAPALVKSDSCRDRP